MVTAATPPSCIFVDVGFLCVYTPIVPETINQLHPIQCTCFNLRRAARVVTRIFDEGLRPSGLRSTQFSILAVLNGVGSSTINELAKALVMDRTTLARNLKPLETHGLVEVISGKDLRTRLVALTPAGRKLLARALPLWEQTQRDVIDRLGDGPWYNLMERLQQVVALA